MRELSFVEGQTWNVKEIDYTICISGLTSQALCCAIFCLLTSRRNSQWVLRRPQETISRWGPAKAQHDLFPNWIHAAGSVDFLLFDHHIGAPWPQSVSWAIKAQKTSASLHSLTFLGLSPCTDSKCSFPPSCKSLHMLVSLPDLLLQTWSTAVPKWCASWFFQAGLYATKVLSSCQPGGTKLCRNPITSVQHDALWRDPYNSLVFNKYLACVSSAMPRASASISASYILGGKWTGWPTKKNSSVCCGQCRITPFLVCCLLCLFLCLTSLNCPTALHWRQLKEMQHSKAFGAALPLARGLLFGAASVRGLFGKQGDGKTTSQTQTNAVAMLQLSNKSTPFMFWTSA